MKKVLKELKAFTQENGNIRFYLFHAALLTLIIILNYAYDIEKKIDVHARTSLDFWGHVGLYFVPYYLTIVGYCFWVEKSFKRLNFTTHLVILFAVVVMAFNEYFYQYKPYIEGQYNSHVAYLILKCANNLFSTLTYCVPIFIFWWFWQRKEQPFYGLSAKYFDPKVYFILLLIMVPIVVGASFDESFNSYYPRYKDYGTLEYFNIPEWLGVTIFEICYGIDFIATELFFRGFLILAMMRFLGPSAVFGMVTVYCAIHFGKPMGETISSIFGGYVLGVITWYTRSIYGGIIIHLGIAWLMELVAFWQKGT